MKALFVLPQIATLVALYLFQDILSPLKKKILEKRDDYGPTGNGGNGLILHSSLALDPDFGQPLGLLWEKLWHRQQKASPPPGETSTAKKKRLKKERLIAEKRAFKEKESYRWVEAFQKVNKLFKGLEMPDGGLLMHCDSRL